MTFCYKSIKPFITFSYQKIVIDSVWILPCPLTPLHILSGFCQLFGHHWCLKGLHKIIIIHFSLMSLKVAKIVYPTERNLRWLSKTKLLGHQMILFRGIERKKPSLWKWKQWKPQFWKNLVDHPYFSWDMKLKVRAEVVGAREKTWIILTNERRLGRFEVTCPHSKVQLLGLKWIFWALKTKMFKIWCWLRDGGWIYT